MRKLINFRSILKGGEVSVPVVPSPLIEAVDQPLAPVAGDVHLAFERALGRPGTERFAFDRPGAVVGPFEIGDENVVLGRRGRGCQEEESGRQQSSFHGATPKWGLAGE